MITTTPSGYVKEIEESALGSGTFVRQQCRAHKVTEFYSKLSWRKRASNSARTDKVTAQLGNHFD